MRFAALIAVILFSSMAFGELQVYPTRIHLSDRVGVTKITLKHLGDKAATYQMRTVFYRMKPDGSMEIVDNPAQEERPIVVNASRRDLRFSPARVNLSPGLEQVVMVMYAGPRNLPDGEYRAHLLFEPTGENAQTVSDTKTKGISLQLSAKMALAVPVIYTRGTPKFEATLSNLRLMEMPNHQKAFSVELASIGTAFAFGDFITYLMNPDKTNSEQVGLVRGVASYLPKRTVSYPVTIPKDRTLSGKILRIEFHQPEDLGGKLIQASEAVLK